MRKFLIIILAFVICLFSIFPYVQANNETGNTAVENLQNERNEIQNQMNEANGQLEGVQNDLSENLYRSCCKQPLRFGHSRSAFFEDRDVVSKVQQAIPVGIYHGIENVHFIEDEKVCPPPTFEYVNTHLVQGINGCRVPVLGVDCIK